MAVQKKRKQFSMLRRADLAGHAMNRNRHRVVVIGGIVAAVIHQQRGAGIGLQVGVLLSSAGGGKHNTPQIGSDGKRHQAGIRLLLALGRQHRLNLRIQQLLHDRAKWFGTGHGRPVWPGKAKKAI